ncbi:MAG: glycosyltransferase [Bacilli bacterium]
MKVSILTMFNGLSSTYSLVNVVAEEIKMLLSDNIEVSILVTEHCPDNEKVGIFLDPRIKWIKIINSRNNKVFNWRTYSKDNNIVHKSFYKEVSLIKKDFIKYLSSSDICIMHDILYQGTHLIHNVAIRKAQKYLPKLQFISLSHSAPIPHIKTKYPISCLYEEMPNTTYIYPTQVGLDAISKQYNTSINNCYCINNSIDTLESKNEEVNIIKKHINMYADILIVYPARLTMSKRFHIITLLASYIKKYSKKTVSIIFCDFESSDIPSNTYKYIIKDIGKQNGLEETDILFTSDIGFNSGVKRETVYELFTFSNLYICPSYSESFGLTVIEAASKGNFIVLNEAVPALKEIGSTINAYFMRWNARCFTYDTFEKYLPSERLYYIDNTNKIINLMDNNPVIKAKTLSRIRYSNKWIYENQLKPLLNKLYKKSL